MTPQAEANEATPARTNTDEPSDTEDDSLTNDVQDRDRIQLSHDRTQPDSVGQAPDARISHDHLDYISRSLDEAKGRRTNVTPGKKFKIRNPTRGR